MMVGEKESPRKLPSQKGAIGSFLEAAKISEADRTAIRDQVEAAGPQGSAAGQRGREFPSKHIYGRPINEVDPFVFEDTFCVLARKFNKNIVYRFGASRSLYIFGPLSSIRRLSVFIITHQLFDLMIVLAIVANCIALGFDNNELVEFKDDKVISGVSYFTAEYNLPPAVELSFLAIYTFEMVFKIIAKGFVLNRFSYLRNGWNVLDFFVVVCGFLTEVVLRTPQIEEVTHTCHITSGQRCEFDLDVLRTFRVLRAVKAISILPGLRMMINALLNAIAQLLEVMALTFFCLCVFALFALSVYSGKLHQICVLIKGSETSIKMYKAPILEPIDPNSPNAQYDWSLWVSNRNNWLARNFPKKEFVPCSNESGGRSCPEDYVCLPDLGDNPDGGWTSFDTFFRSMLSTFQLITLDFWERIYELIMSTAGPSSLPFFIIIVFLGSFYLLNLMLAVVAMSYETEAHSWQKKPLTKHQRLAFHRTHSTFSFPDPRQLNVTIMTKFRRRTPEEREDLARTLRNISPETDITHEYEGLTEAVMDILGVHFDEPITLAHVHKIRPPLPQTMSETLTSDSHDLLKKQKSFIPRWQNAVASEHTFEQEDASDIVREDDILEHKFEAKEGVAVEVDDLMSTMTSAIDGDGEDHGGASDYDHDRYDDDDDDENDESVALTPITETDFDSLQDIENEVDEYSDSTGSSDSNRDQSRDKKITHLRCLRMPKRHLQHYVHHGLFEHFITFCIVINTLLLSIEHYDQPEILTEIHYASTYLFIIIFSYESAFKIFVLQKDFFSQNWNIFDLTIVTGSYLDVFIDSETFGGFSNAIRGFRLLRIFRLSQSWLTMKILLNIIFSTFGALGNLTLVLTIVIYIFAILGMQLVGQRYTPSNFGAESKDSDAFPRWNFENFWYAFMMVFRVLCQEWIEPMWDCLEAHKDSQEVRCFFVFLPILIIGNFIVLNLFLALLLSSFNTEEINAQRERVKENYGKMENLKKIVEVLITKSRSEEKENSQVPVEMLETESPSHRKQSAWSRVPKRVVNVDTDSYNENFKRIGRKVISHNRREIAERAIEKAKAILERRNKRETNRNLKRNPIVAGRQRSFVATALSRRTSTSDSSFMEQELTLKPCMPSKFYEFWGRCCTCIHSHHHPHHTKRTRWGRWDAFRKWCLNIASHTYFEWVILILILVSSILLCFEDVYLEDNADLKLTLFIMNNVLLLIFILEMLLKTAAMGVYTYYTTMWTLLDAFIILVGVLTLIIDVEQENWTPKPERRGAKAIDALKVLRILRALRPLRAISRWSGMRVVVNALIHAIPSIFNVLLVCLLFWLVFAIMGVQFFKGKFSRCVYNDNGTVVPYDYMKTKLECCSTTYTSWVNAQPNFDHVPQSYLALFQVATFEGWMQIMRSAIDAHPSNLNVQNKRDRNFGAYFYFVVFIIFGSFFTLNLFVGVIIDNFNMLKKKYEGNLLEAFLTPNQRRYYTAVKKLGRKKPKKLIPRPESKILGLYYDIALSRKLEIAIFVMIVANMIIMAFESHNQSKFEEDILDGFNIFFSIIYTLEALLKLIGLRYHYFKVPWNVFDFILVLLAIVDLAVEESELRVPFPPTLLRVIRVFRVGRIVRLVKAAKGIRKLLFALVISLPALMNIGALLFLVTFIYAILGMAQFKDAVITEALDDVFSFQTFFKSCLVLLRLMTAAGWDEVLAALLNLETQCGVYRNIECGGEGEAACIANEASIIYIVSYLAISYLIIINMYIAIILENFVEAHRDEEVGVIDEDLEMFYIRWSKFDPLATQFIGFDQLSEFLGSLEPPFQIPKPNLVAIVSFNLPIARGNKIHCLDVLHALVKHVLGDVDDSADFRKVQSKLDRTFRKQFPSRKMLDIVSSTRVWKIQHNAAMIIQKAWRAYRKRRHPPAEKTRSMQTISSRVNLRVGRMMRRFSSAGGPMQLIGQQAAAGRRRMSNIANSIPFIGHRRSSMAPAAAAAAVSKATVKSGKSRISKTPTPRWTNE